MAVDLETSPIFEELNLITQDGGSPYFIITALIHCGGKDITPLQVLRLDNERDYRQRHSDNQSIVLSLGVGTVMNDIGPYQDDIKITVNIAPADGTGNQKTALAVDSRTYVAYLGDEIPRPSDTAHNPSLTDTETANRSAMKHVTFVLEEVAVSQLRKQSLGTIGKACPPYELMRSLLVNTCQALKLGKDEVINSFQMEPPNNTTARDHVIVPDNTPALEIPDYIQNHSGGIYSTALGFYIQAQIVYTWPLYDTTRQDTASRVLQIVMAPSRHSTMLDKTWRDGGRMISIYAAGISTIKDDTLGNMNTHGNAVRYTNASQLLEGGVTVANNKMTANRNANNQEFSTTTLGNGQNVAKLSGAKVTDNVYLEASKMAARAGAHMMIPWKRSNPNKITPGMAVEINYDHAGTIRTIPGALLACHSSYELEGQGMNAARWMATSSLTVFIDRNDPDYLAYLQGGGTVSAVPEIASIQ
jgi:hypothetical protein